jgi:hypothetical protein
MLKNTTLNKTVGCAGWPDEARTIFTLDSARKVRIATHSSRNVAPIDIRKLSHVFGHATPLCVHLKTSPSDMCLESYLYETFRGLMLEIVKRLYTRMT